MTSKGSQDGEGGEHLHFSLDLVPTLATYIGQFVGVRDLPPYQSNTRNSPQFGYLDLEV